MLSVVAVGEAPDERVWTAGGSVPLLRWPLQRDVAEELESCGQPFLLFVAADAEPPVLPYALADWVRSPIDAEELVARRTTVENRYLRSLTGARPHLDETGRLTFRSACVDVAPSQIAAVSLFVEHYGEIVENDRLRRAFGIAQNAEAEVFKSRLTRLRRRLRRVGLDVRRANQVGFALESTAPG